jgi:hypothetical protein
MSEIYEECAKNTSGMVDYTDYYTPKKTITISSEVLTYIFSKSTMLSTTKFIMPSLLTPYIDNYSENTWPCLVESIENRKKYQITAIYICSIFRKVENMIKEYLKNILETAISNNIGYYYDFNNSSMIKSNKSIFYNNKYKEIVTNISKIFYSAKKISIMINGELSHQEILILQNMLHYELYSNGIFPMSVFNVDLTNKMTDIMEYLNQSTQYTPVIVSFTNITECYENIISTKEDKKYNNNCWTVTKKSINDFYDKLENIDGLISLSFCSKSRKDLNDMISLAEDDTRTPYKSMYRKGRINYYIDIIENMFEIYSSE